LDQGLGASCALSHGSRDLSIVAQNPRVADMILSAERVPSKPGRIFLSMIEGVAGVGPRHGCLLAQG
jgi:hypothetical protein